MDIQMRSLNTNGLVRWDVSLGKHHVSFRSEDEARAFVATLQARLRAPHSLPDQALQRRAG